MPAERLTPYERNALEELLGATRTIESHLEGNVSLEQFLQQYDDFYYAAALDGHEPNPEFSAILAITRPVVELHGRVQRILDRIHFAPPAEYEMYRRAGRLRSDEVETALRDSVSLADVRRVIELLLALLRDAG